MKFSHVVPIPADVARTWSYVAAVATLASCVPGSDQLTELGDGRYRGAFRVRIGPVRLRFVGELSVQRRDEDSHTSRLHASAQDSGADGAVEADIDLTVVPGATPDAAVVRIDTDAQILGRVGEFGQPVIRRKADQTMAEFAADLARALGGPA